MKCDSSKTPPHRLRNFFQQCGQFYCLTNLGQCFTWKATNKVSVKPSPAKTNRQAPMSLPVCLIIMIVFFGKIHPFPKCSLAFSVALVQKQIAVWIIKLFRLLPLLEKCGFYNLKYPTVEIFARCGTICFYAVQDKISKEIFLVHRITVF